MRGEREAGGGFVYRARSCEIAPEEFRQIDSSRKWLCALAWAMGGSICVLFGYAALSFDDLVGWETPSLALLVAVVLALATLLVVSIHQWALRVIDPLYRMATVDGGGAQCVCGYCGGSPAEVVCSSCDSIQWSRLGGGARGPDIRIHGKSLRWHWALAVFVCHYRFQLLAAVASTLLVGVVPFAYQLVQNRAAQREELHRVEIERGRAVIEANLAYRSELQRFMLECAPVRQGYAAGCYEQLEKVAKQYLEVSWNSAPVFQAFRRRQCSVSRPAAWVDHIKRGLYRGCRFAQASLNWYGWAQAKLSAVCGGDASGDVDDKLVGIVRTALSDEEGTGGVGSGNQSSPESRDRADSRAVDLNAFGCFVLRMSDPVGYSDGRYRAFVNAAADYLTAPTSDAWGMVEAKAALLYFAGHELGCETFALTYAGASAEDAAADLDAYRTCLRPLWWLAAEMEVRARRTSWESGHHPAVSEECSVTGRRASELDWVSRGLKLAVQCEALPSNERQVQCVEGDPSPCALAKQAPPVKELARVGDQRRPARPGARGRPGARR